MKSNAILFLFCVLFIGHCELIDKLGNTTSDSEDIPAEVPENVKEFSKLMNDHREESGCERLKWFHPLYQVALDHSIDMIDRDFFDHVNPDGHSPQYRALLAGIEATTLGENISGGTSSAALVLEGWLDSPGHRENIENCSYSYHAVGFYDGCTSEFDCNSWTHMFAEDAREMTELGSPK